LQSRRSAQQRLEAAATSVVFFARATLELPDEKISLRSGKQERISPAFAPKIPAGGAAVFRNVSRQCALPNRKDPKPRDNPMTLLPVDRALSIYSTLADRFEPKGARERLSRHLMKKYIDGEQDQHRLTVHGLSYLRELEREIDSRS
jgi:hypothetical protein